MERNMHLTEVDQQMANEDEYGSGKLNLSLNRFAEEVHNDYRFATKSFQVSGGAVYAYTIYNMFLHSKGKYVLIKLKRRREEHGEVRWLKLVW